MALFDPVLIVFQIIALQCFYYLAMGTLLGLFHAIFDIRVSLDYFFTSQYLDFVSYVGWITSISILLAAVIGAYLLSVIVEKAKKCVDFTFTLYFIHVVVCTFYYEIPLEWEWWVAHVLGSVIMASLVSIITRLMFLAFLHYFFDGIALADRNLTSIGSDLRIGRHRTCAAVPIFITLFASIFGQDYHKRNMKQIKKEEYDDPLLRLLIRKNQFYQFHTPNDQDFSHHGS